MNEEFFKADFPEAQSDARKLARYEVAGYAVEKTLRPEKTPEIPSSLQDGFLPRHPRHLVPG